MLNNHCTWIPGVSSSHRDRRNALRLLRPTRLVLQHDANGLLKTSSKGIATTAGCVETQCYDLFGRPRTVGRNNQRGLRRAIYVPWLISYLTIAENGQRVFGLRTVIGAMPFGYCALRDWSCSAMLNAGGRRARGLDSAHRLRRPHADQSAREGLA